MRKNKPLELQEVGGDRFPDLETVQSLALPGLARDIALTLQELLTAGILVIQDGRIVTRLRREAST